jgi:hypothetical protein
MSGTSVDPSIATLPIATPVSVANIAPAATASTARRPATWPSH